MLGVDATKDIATAKTVTPPQAKAKESPLPPPGLMSMNIRISHYSVGFCSTLDLLLPIDAVIETWIRGAGSFTFT